MIITVGVRPAAIAGVVPPLELSANDFQMNLAAEVIKTENIRGERRIIDTNKDVGVRVRKAMQDSGATLPENLPLEEPIKEVRKRVAATKTKKLPPPCDPSNE